MPFFFCRNNIQALRGRRRRCLSTEKGGSRSLEYFNTFFFLFSVWDMRWMNEYFKKKTRTVTVTNERRNQWILIRYGQCQKQRKKKNLFLFLVLATALRSGNWRNAMMSPPSGTLKIFLFFFGGVDYRVTYIFSPFSQLCVFLFLRNETITSEKNTHTHTHTHKPNWCVFNDWRKVEKELL